MLSTENLGLCSWSIEPNNPDDLLFGLSQLGMKKTQVALEPMRHNIDTWRFTGARIWEAGVQMVSGMVETIGEDYTTPQTIRETGGVVSDENWEANRKNIRECMKLASSLDISTITLHAGFIPGDEQDPHYHTMLDRIDDLGKLAEELLDDGWLLLETGQETAETMWDFHSHLIGENIGINFDPANMILYNTGDPIEAMHQLMPLVKQVHIKDALPPEEPGQWGEEVPVGQGAVDWPAFFKLLIETGYDGPMIIEREAGESRLDDIKTAADFVSKTLSELS